MTRFHFIKHYYLRGRQGYCLYDCWSIQNYLSEILPPMLRQLKKGHGCPSDFFDRENKNNECAKWHETLEEMAQGFEAAQFIGGGKYHQKFIKNAQGDYTLEIDQQALNNAHEKMKKGLQLFADNFLGLWD